ncbi:hypothetical protein GCM10010530_76990 [Kribbella aluminosa]
MQVPRREIAGQVVRRTGPAEVDVRDEPELAQRVESAVHGRPMDPRPELLGTLTDLLRAQMLLGPREHLDHREPGRRHPLPTLPQPLRADLDSTRHPRSSQIRWL